MVKTSERKVLAHEVVSTNRMSITLACRTFMISETYYRYASILKNENLKIAALLLDLTESKRSWGFIIFAQCKKVQVESQASLPHLP